MSDLRSSSRRSTLNNDVLPDVPKDQINLKEMKILTARLASEDRFWSRTTLCSLPEALDGSCGIWLKRYWNFDAAVTWQSHATPRGSGWKFPDFRTIQIRCFKRLTSREFRGESSGDLRNKLVIKGLPILIVVADLLCFRHLFVLKFWGISSKWESVRRPFGGEKIRYRELEHAWSAFRLSMFRHLFIDLLEYGGVRVLSMLNFYSSCLRPYFGKVLDYDSMSLDIIEYPYLVVYMIILI
ncbi:hypothetical protein H5410_015974 [Solanum commersonii]|uniref:Uncharacterized protein n=1 Tax=Solanum commersonii TaxID=4109 RepID=A0A9J5ZV70_SOLCO|nr:hypothetical protein H5410_015974 [Solanum commersonii]